MRFALPVAQEGDMKKQNQRMPSKSKRAGAKRGAARGNSGDNDALEVLKRQHREVESLIARFEKARTNEDARAIAGDICDKLTVHATIEEEIFYPAAKEQEKDIILEAAEEHLSVKRIIADVEGLDAEDERLRPKVSVLKEQVSHHVDEEEHELFPKIKRKISKADRDALGKQLSDRAEQLQAADNGAPPARREWPVQNPANRPETGSGRRSH
jgi:hypothetical protein